MTSELKCPFRQGYEKPLHYPCTIMVKLKPNCSYDKRLYCDIFSLYYKREKEWDMGDLKDKIEWWCYATDLERYIKQSQKDLEIARKALEKYADEDMWETCNIWEVDYEKAMFVEHGYKIAEEALEQINHKED